MLHFGVYHVHLSNRLEALGEPDPGAARPRTARARPHYSLAAGEEPAEVSTPESTRALNRTSRSAPVLRPFTRTWCCIARNAAAASRRSSKSRPASRSIISKRSPSGRISPELRAAFHLYVPSSMVDVARRLCEDNQITVNEIWSFHGIGDDVRFTLVHRSREAAPAPRRSRRASPGRPLQRRKAAAPSSVRCDPAKAGPRGRSPRRRRPRRTRNASKPCPFSDFPRDKRGYEAHLPGSHAEPAWQAVAVRAILYWYRTPPGVRVGRPPFDDEVRRTLEAQNPDVTFDWQTHRSRRRCRHRLRPSTGANVAASSGPPNRRSGPMKRPRCETIARRHRVAGAIGSDDPTATGDDTRERQLVPRTVRETVARRTNLNRHRMMLCRPTWLRGRPNAGARGRQARDRRTRRSANADGGDGGGDVAGGRLTQVPVLANRRWPRRRTAETP